MSFLVFACRNPDVRRGHAVLGRELQHKVRQILAERAEHAAERGTHTEDHRVRRTRAARGGVSFELSGWS